MSRFGWFIFGVVATCATLALGAYLYVNEGGLQMAVDSPEFPFEAALANMALNASLAGSLNLNSPVRLTAENLTAGGQIFKSHCAGCHGLPGKASSMGKRMFPRAPQLLDPNEMVTDDPVGETYWKITNGIRLSGMPEFKTALSENQRWQVAMMLKHADKLPPAAQAALSAH
jgi:mono/diheme cytochrome c family protein